MPLTDLDPWFWTTEQVVQFFRDEAQDLMSDRPNGHLPDLGPFVHMLAENEADGCSLLDDVNTRSLSEDFGIRSWPMRSKIMHCIRKLQRLSSHYNSAANVTERAVPQTPVSTGHVETELDERSIVSTKQLEIPVGGKIRKGEVLVHDETGRKRRKLAVMTVEPTAASRSLTEGHDPDQHAYLSDAKMPVDELFYGNTPFGQDVGDLQPSGSVVVKDDENFEFGVQSLRTAGEVAYVAARMRHLLYNNSGISSVQDGKGIMAIYPYPEQILPRYAPLSATIFRPSDEGIVAKREKASYLERGLSYSQTGQATSEWDGLMARHTPKDDKVLGVFGDDDDDYEKDGEARTTTGSDAGDEAVEEGEVTDEVDTARVVSETITEIVNTWQTEQLPKLEERKAWTVWKKMKRSSTVRKFLVEGGQARIQYLTKRLEKMKERILEDKSSSVAALKKQCESMEPTIHDREEQKWMNKVWQRDKEPAHIVRHGLSGSTQSRAGPAESTFGALHIPGPANLPQDIGESSPSGTEADSAQPMPEDADFDDSDERSVNVDIDVPSNPSGDLDLGDIPSSPPGGMAESSTDIGVVPDIGIDTDGDDQPLPSWEDDMHETPIVVKEDPRDHDYMPPAKDKRKHQNHAPSSDSDFPSPTQLIKTIPRSQRIKQEEPGTPTRGSERRVVNTEPIDLTLSSDPPAPCTSPKSTRKAKKGKLDRLVGSPEDATLVEIDSWDYSALAEDQDRKRIIIKLLKDMNGDTVAAIHDRIKKLFVPHFKTDTQTAVKWLKKGGGKMDGFEPKVSDLLLTIGRLYLCWYQASAKYLEAELPFDVHWDHISQDVSQVDQYRAYVLMVLDKREKLFSSPRRTPGTVKARAQHILISSDDDLDRQLTPHNKRKRPVQQSQIAVEKRRNAQDRMLKGKQREAKFQSIDPSRLTAPLPGSDAAIGPILINPEKEDDQDEVYINSAIASMMKPHQIDGVRFLWRELTASGEDGSQGCLLAHTMGLGKTMQTIAALVAIAEAARTRRAPTQIQLPKNLCPQEVARGERDLRLLVLCPPSLIQNWVREINQWAPGRLLGTTVIIESGPKTTYLDKLKEWHNHGGVLLLGYNLFRSTINRKPQAYADVDAASIDHMLLDGPELVVADEAHTLKDDKSGISIAASRLNTESRVALTGTPMSNDLQEIYALVSWVAPGYLGEPTEFKAFYSDPIKAGTFLDSTAHEVRQSLKKLAVLKHETEPKVNRADITALRGSLKPKVEFLITIPLMPKQTQAYKRYVDALLGGSRNTHASQVAIFSWLAVLTLLTNHPSCFRAKLLEPSTVKRKPKVKPAELDSDAATPGAVGRQQVQAVALEKIMDVTGGIEAPGDAHVSSFGFTPQMIEHILEGLDADLNPLFSAKTTLFLRLLHLSKQCGDKVLVFSMSIPTLQYLDDLLTTNSIPFGRIDGSVQINKRGLIIENFHNGHFEILLVSTRAGGVGLNIQGANRVIIFDFGFNPTWEEQAIGRAYRLGQAKPVFVYRFVAGGTFETNLYNKALFKTTLVSRVVDKKNPARNAERNTRDYLYEPQQVQQEDIRQVPSKDPQVLDNIIALHDPAQGADTYIRAIKTMETLQAEADDAPLSAEELQEVADEIKMGKAGRKLGAVAAGIAVAGPNGTQGWTA